MLAERDVVLVEGVERAGVDGDAEAGARRASKIRTPIHSLRSTSSKNADEIVEPSLPSSLRGGSSLVRHPRILGARKGTRLRERSFFSASYEALRLLARPFCSSFS